MLRQGVRAALARAAIEHDGRGESMNRILGVSGCGIAFLLLAVATPVLAGGGKAAGEGAAAQRVDGDGPSPLGPPGTGRATVSWEAPTRRDDGSCLEDLAGFVVKWGPMRGRMDRSVRLSPAEASCSATGRRTECGAVEACRHTVTELGPIKWYFTVQAYDSQGAESVEPTAVFLDMD